MREIRTDNLNNDIVIVASDRSKRPIDKTIREIEEKSILEYEKECPFCRGNEDYTEKEKFKIEDKSGWLVRSVNNKFPIVDNSSKEIYGEHEVIIDTYRHNGNFYNMSENEFKNLFTIYKERYVDLMSDNKIEHISIFKNFLRESGASLIHPHSQIISLSIVPPEIENEIDVSKSYYEENKTCIYEDIIKSELKFKKRIIHNGTYFLIIVPYASKYSGEVRVIFKQNIVFEEMNESHIEELSQLFNKLFKNLYSINGCSAFNLCIHTHPLKLESKNIFNVHMHIIPRKYSFGGFELGTGLYVSSINPEELADRLKF